MPIDSQNELPHLRFPVGQDEESVSITGLYDTGAALTTGLLSYHNYIMERQPNAVAEYEEFDGSNPFDPIKLCGAITNPNQYDQAQHGILTAVIRYRTPFVHADSGKPVLLSVALGKDVTVDTIFGIPFISSLQMEFRFRPEPMLIAHSIERQFSAIFRETICSTKYPRPAQHTNTATSSGNLTDLTPNTTDININTNPSSSVPAFLHQPLLHYMTGHLADREQHQLDVENKFE